MKSIFIAFALCFCSLLGNAQTGCIIVYGVDASDTRVYTTVASGTSTCNGQTVTKYSSANFTTLSAGCVWSPNPAAAPATTRNCIVGSSCGVKATYTQQCPIDSNLLFLVLATACIGYFTLYKHSNIGFALAV